MKKQDNAGGRASLEEVVRRLLEDVRFGRLRNFKMAILRLRKAIEQIDTAATSPNR